MLPMTPDPRLSFWAHPLVWLAAAVLALGLVGTLLAALAPVLFPFLMAALLAYLGQPVVRALTRYGVNRDIGAVLAILALVGALVALGLVLLPIVQYEISRFIERLPALIEFFRNTLQPWISRHLGMELQIDSAGVARFLKNHREAAETLAGNLLNSLGSGGAAILNLLATLLVTPVVMFYLLRDGPAMARQFEKLLPVPMRAHARRIVTNINRVVAEFLRGQLSVMAALAVFYSFALWLIDLDYALPVGLVTGILVFVPYIGFGLGLVLALLIGFQQGWSTFLLAGAVFALGQILESFILTPRLVGERIGLHPVAVIFALMAFGELLGFIGVLLALPASAILLVGWRELRAVYVRSDFYRGRSRS
jgi:predicted PurR-regulated permease PerM